MPPNTTVNRKRKAEGSPAGPPPQEQDMDDSSISKKKNRAGEKAEALARARAWAAERRAKKKGKVDDDGRAASSAPAVSTKKPRKSVGAAPAGHAVAAPFGSPIPARAKSRKSLGASSSLPPASAAKKSRKSMGAALPASGSVVDRAREEARAAINQRLAEREALLAVKKAAKKKKKAPREAPAATTDGSDREVPVKFLPAPTHPAPVRRGRNGTPIRGLSGGYSVEEISSEDNDDVKEGKEVPAQRRKNGMRKVTPPPPSPSSPPSSPSPSREEELEPGDGDAALLGGHMGTVVANTLALRPSQLAASPPLAPPVGAKEEEKLQEEEEESPTERGSRDKNKVPAPSRRMKDTDPRDDDAALLGGHAGTVVARILDPRSQPESLSLPPPAPAATEDYEHLSNEFDAEYGEDDSVLTDQFFAAPPVPTSSSGGQRQPPAPTTIRNRIAVIEKERSYIAAAGGVQGPSCAPLFDRTSPAKNQRGSPGRRAPPPSAAVTSGSVSSNGVESWGRAMGAPLPSVPPTVAWTGPAALPIAPAPAASWVVPSHPYAQVYAPVASFVPPAVAQTEPTASPPASPPAASWMAPSHPPTQAPSWMTPGATATEQHPVHAYDGRGESKMTWTEPLRPPMREVPASSSQRPVDAFDETQYRHLDQTRLLSTPTVHRPVQEYSEEQVNRLDQARSNREIVKKEDVGVVAPPVAGTVRNRTVVAQVIVWTLKVLFLMVVIFLSGGVLIHFKSGDLNLKNGQLPWAASHFNNKKSMPPCFSDTPEAAVALLDVDAAAIMDRDGKYLPPPWFQDLRITKCRKPTYVELAKSGVEGTTAGSLPCPMGGTCLGGYLRNCAATSVSSSQMDFSEDMTSCVFTPEAQEFVMSIVRTLAELTVEAKCSCGWRALLPGMTTLDAGNETCGLKKEEIHRRPGGSMFVAAPAVTRRMNQRAAGMDGDTCAVSDVRQFVGMLPELDVVVDGAADLLSLGPRASLSHLQIPPACWMWDVLIDILLACISVPLWVLSFLYRTTTAVFLAYPTASVASSLFFWLANCIVTNRRSRSRDRASVSELRDEAYARLIDVRCIAAAHLRDELAMQLHPSDSAKRRRMTLILWPKVVVEVRSDSRVKQVERLGVGGQVEEHWEWIAPVTPSRGVVKE
mmetsp:Transcript_16485/g.32754  ORF Transcript_16485/g.32754 Transcript_16485/m.32754 type:complete len:1144 (+) Transcript_16485:178-3609(+)